MTVLLDENIPLQLYRRLRDAGYEAEHIIISGQRGIPDSEIRARLAVEERLILITQDTEFLALEHPGPGVVVVSRVPQRLPIERRVEIWFSALHAFLASPPPAGHLFELLPSGDVVAWASST